MRIVHVITRFIRGGADENTLLTCNGQAAMGHEVHLVAGDHHADMVAALDPGVRFHHYPRLVRAPRPWSDLSCVTQLTSLFRRLRPEIVHTHESKAGILGRIAARFAGVPLIVHGVHILPFVGVSKPVAAVYLALEKAVSGFTDVYVDVSEGMRDLCLRHGVGSPASHFVIASGMDVTRFSKAAPIPRDQLLPGRELDDCGVIALMAGTLEPRKRVLEVVEEIGRTRDAADWLLLVAGTGSEFERIAAKIAELELGHRVVLLGHRPDLERVIASSDFCLHAAVNEGLPRVVVQYVLAGKPVIASGLAGLDNVVREAANGEIISSRRVDELVLAAHRLAGDGAARARYGEAARKLDLSAWDHRTMVTAIEKAYGWGVRAKQGLGSQAG